MPYYPTLAEDLARAKEILERGKPRCECWGAPSGVHLDTCPEQNPLVRETGAIFGADIYAAYKLLESFVEAIEAVDPKVCEVAMRAERLAKGGRGQG